MQTAFWKSKGNVGRSRAGFLRLRTEFGVGIAREYAGVMVRALQALGVLFWVVGLGWWLAGGANRGFTRNQEQVKVLDEITGIEAIEWRQKFSPGLEFLGGAVVAGVGCWGAAWVLRKRAGSQPISPK
jgi:hypothetical protein